MPTCNLTIEFYRPDRTYASGEKINGWVRVSVDRNVRCRGLMLAARWETSGRGTPSRGNYFQDTLYQGPWAPGELYEYAFEIPAPGGPFSWHGKNFDLDHFVSVHADLPWAIETRTEKSFRLEPGSLVAPSQEPVLSSFGSPGRFWNRWAALFGVAILLSGLFLLAFQQWVAGTIATIAGLAVGYVKRSAVSRWNLSRLQWEMPDEVSPGEHCPIRVRIAPGRFAAVRAMKLRMRGVELVCSGREENRDRFRHEIFCEDFPLNASMSSDGTNKTEFAASIAIPDIAAWSIDLPGNQIIWSFRLTICQSWWPTRIETREIRLIPRIDQQSLGKQIAGND